MLKRKRSSSPVNENDGSLANLSDSKTLTQPFTKKTVNQSDRKQQQHKALTALSKFLSVSDKYAKAWEKQKQQHMDNNTFKSENKYFIGELRDYQLTGVKWMETLYLSGINGILADEMGLGKTVQIIALLSKLQTQGVKGMHLICVPLSTIPNWKSEFNRFAPKFPIISFYGNLEERTQAQRQMLLAAKQPPAQTEIYPVVIMPHHFMKPETVSFFTELKFIYFIIDEGHKLKNYETQVSKAARQIKCHNKLLLTGTPLQNNMTELWSLLNFIMPTIFCNLEIFEQLIQAEDLANEIVITSNLNENRTVVETIQRVLEPFMLRRLKKDVLSENVPMKSVRVYCEMTGQQLEFYVWAIEKDIKRLKGERDKTELLAKEGRKLRAAVRYTDDEPDVRLEALAPEPKELPTHMHNLRFQHPLMLYRRIVNHPYLMKTPLIPGTPHILVDENIVTESGKMRVLDALLTRLLQRGHKVLIFSTLVIMLDLIQDYLYLREIPHARLTGKDKVDVREEQIDMFNNDPTVNVFLVSTRAGGQGINLTAADTVIFYDSDWNPHMDLQAQARCHRIGQTKPVMVYTLVSKNSLDEYVLRCADLKLRLEKAIMFGERNREENIEFMEELLTFLKKGNAGNLHPNGTTLSDEELEALLDRTDMLTEMENNTQMIKDIPK